MNIKRPGHEYWDKGSRSFSKLRTDFSETSPSLCDSIGSVDSLDGDEISTTIMVVDDNKIVRLVCSNTIEEYTDLDAQTFDNGKLGLKAYLDNPGKYFLILMDLNMPVMNGFEATKAIQAFEKLNALTRVPIICISGESDNFKEALNLGMTDVIGKPIKAAVLASLIEKLLKEENIIESDKNLKASPFI